MTRTSPPEPKTSHPYCSNCGYTLTGLTESSKCPECGRPIVEVLTRASQFPNFGKRYRSKATLFGWPVIDVALGPKDGELRGKAKGIIAIGDVAVAGIAIGGASFGGVCMGGVCVGLCSIGGMSIGILTALGGFAIGGLALGGGAVGILASGGGAVGFAAQGGGAFGVYTRDGRTPWNTPGPPIFEQLAWFFGAWPPKPNSMMLPLLVILGITLALAAIVALVALPRLTREPSR